MNDINRELVRGLSEREVEIEHLKTTVVALNEKVEVTHSLLLQQFLNNIYRLSMI